MSLNVEGTTLISAVKKLLLSKREVTQIGVAQILSLVLQKQEKVRYAGVILESDLAGEKLRHVIKLHRFGAR